MNALKALFASLVLLFNTLIHISILLPLSLFKLVLPFRPVRRRGTGGAPRAARARGGRRGSDERVGPGHGSWPTANSCT